jgi:hypothetical protein
MLSGRPPRDFILAREGPRLRVGALSDLSYPAATRGDPKLRLELHLHIGILAGALGIGLPTVTL